MDNVLPPKAAVARRDNRMIDACRCHYVGRLGRVCNNNKKQTTIVNLENPAQQNYDLRRHGFRVQHDHMNHYFGVVQFFVICTRVDVE
eukprot:5196906-Amphidinium_carterae.1